MSEKREYFWDNLKFILILLVVIGHFAEPHTASSQFMRNLYVWIYSFHMPLFIFISGYFSKSTINKERFKIEKIFSYALLYGILKLTIFGIYRVLLNSPNRRLNLWSDYSAPWFLIGLILWLCITNCIKNIKPKYMLTLSLILSFIIGYDKSVRDFLALSRVIVFYPFFLAGYYIEKESITRILKSKKIKIFSIVVLILSIVAVIFYSKDFYELRPFFTGRNPYALIDTPVNGIFYRIGAFLISSCMSLSVLCLAPRGKTVFSAFGARTLQVYALHAMFMPIYGDVIKEPLINMFPNRWLVISITMSIILTILLSLKVFEYPFKKIMSIKFGDNILRKDKLTYTK